MVAALPHLITGSRLVSGAAAIVAALDGALFASATLITLGALADGLDGHVARWLRADSPFGALFDYFCDYLTLVVAPWLLARALVGEPTVLQEALLALPLIFGAVRYARNGVTVARSEAAPDLPGVATVFAAFVSVTAVFLDAPGRLTPQQIGTIIPPATALLAALMIVPFRYPKLTRFTGWSPAVLILLGLMPFAGTQPIAAAAVVLGLLYIVIGPFLVLRS